MSNDYKAALMDSPVEIERRKIIQIPAHELSIILKEISKDILEELQENNKWPIEAEEHYKDHQDLREFLKTWKDCKNGFSKFIMGLVFVGITVLAGLGLSHK